VRTLSGLLFVLLDQQVFGAQVMKDMYRRLVQSGLRMVCILTKVDLVDAEVEADVAEVQYSAVLQRLRECVARETGMPLNQVSALPVGRTCADAANSEISMSSLRTMPA
jgi:GTP-binding protein EngB required for normal cell division